MYFIDILVQRIYKILILVRVIYLEPNLWAKDGSYKYYLFQIICILKNAIKVVVILELINLFYINCWRAVFLRPKGVT